MMGIRRHARMSGSGGIVSLAILEKSCGRLAGRSCAAMGEVTAQYDEAAFVWIDALDPADSDFSTLQERFGLHGLAVKDSMGPAQVPKVDVYGDQIFVVL